MELGKPYPHYCAVHNLYYGSPTDTIPATMCPLCGIKAELLSQPAPRTYEVARALSWCDAVANSTPTAPKGWQQGAAKAIVEYFKGENWMEELPLACAQRCKDVEAILARHTGSRKS